MLKPPKVGGADHLRLFVHEIGTERACAILDVHPTTMRRWLRGAVPVPQAALQALYWLTSYGFSDAFAEAHWTHAHLLHQVRELRAQLLQASVRSVRVPRPPRSSAWRSRTALPGRPARQRPALQQVRTAWLQPAARAQ